MGTAFKLKILGVGFIIFWGLVGSQAATLTWDANGVTAAQTDGAGAWLGANLWWNGTANQTWVSGSDAIFGNGGAGGAVTLASPTTAETITFNTFSGTYTLGTSTQALTINSGVTLNSGAGAVSLISPLVVAASQTWTNSSSSLLTASGGITSSATSGSQTITLAGTGSGGVTLSGVLANGVTGGTLAVNSNTSGGAVNTISGGSNTFSGGVTLTQGILRVSQGGSTGTAFGSGVLTLAGGELRVLRTTTAGTTFTGANTVVTGNVQITSEVGGASTVGVNHTLGTLSIGSQTLTIAPGSMVASGTSGITFGATTLTGSSTFSVGSSAQLSLGALTGTAAINKTGAGKLNLTAAATSYSGGLNIDAGTVNVANATALGTGAGTINLGQVSGAADAALEFGTSFSTYATNPIVVRSGSGTRTIITSGGTSGTTRKIVVGAISLSNNLLIQNTATHSGNSAVEFSGGITGTGNLTLDNSPGATATTLYLTTNDINHIGALFNVGTGTTRISSVIGSNVTQITNSGGGTLVLDGANSSFAGNVSVSNGTLKVGNNNALSASNTVAVGALGILDLKQISSTSYDQTVAGLNNISGSGGLVTNTGGIGKTLTLAGSGNYSFDGVVTSMAITKSGSGTQALTGDNTYAGATRITGGILSVDSIKDGGGAVGIPISGYTSGLNTVTVSSAAGLVVGQAFLNTTYLPTGTVITNISGTTVTVSNPALATNAAASTASFGTANSLGISTNAASNLIIDGGTLQYTGGATSTDRLFQVGSATTGSNSTIDASGTGALNFTNTGALTYGTAGTTGTANTRTLTLTGSNTENNTVSALIGNNGAATNGNSAVSLVKSGSGTWVLTNNNTYTGTTTVSSGTLLVNGSLAAGSAVTVASGAKLGGSGTINGAVTVNGRLAPGNSIGTMTVNNDVTWNGSAGQDWEFELGVVSGSSDLLFITGAGSDFLKGSGGINDFNFNFLNTGVAGATYTLVDWTSTTTFSLSDFTYTGLAGGLSGAFAFNGTQLDFIVAPVPEPSTYAMLLGGLTALAFLRRRSKKS